MPFKMNIFYPATHFIFENPIYFLFNHLSFILKEIFFIIFTNDQYNRKLGIKALFTYIKSFLLTKKGKELFDTLKTKISLKQIESQKLIGKRVRMKKILAFSYIEKIGGFSAITNWLLKFISQITKNYFMKSIIVEEFYELNTIALISIIAKKYT